MHQAQRYQLRLISGHLVEALAMLTVQPGMVSNRHQPKTQVQDSKGRGRLVKEQRGTSLNGMVLSCHPERSEGSVSMGVEMLRGVYLERSQWAQHDRAVLLPRHRHRHLRAFCLLSPLLAIQPLLTTLAPTAVDGLFLG